MLFVGGPFDGRSLDSSKSGKPVPYRVEFTLGNPDDGTPELAHSKYPRVHFTEPARDGKLFKRFQIIERSEVDFEVHPLWLPGSRCPECGLWFGDKAAALRSEGSS